MNVQETVQANTLRIEKPSVEDIPHIVLLWQGQYAFHNEIDKDYYVPVTPELIEKFRAYTLEAIEQDKPNILIARENKKIVGFVTYAVGEEEYFDTKIAKFGEIKELFVDEEQRGKGIGRKLVEHAESYFATQGIKDLKIQASVFNPGAIRLYNELGYAASQTVLFKQIP